MTHSSTLPQISHCLPRILSDSIEALFDAWFLGDNFLREAYGTFQGMLNKAKLNKKNWQPYLLEFYNPKGYYYGISNWIGSATSRILNKLIKALNENDRLPKYIIFMIDKDIISNLKELDFGATRNLWNLLNWLTRQIDIAICRKKLQINEKKPGAVIDNHPTVIYINMIRRVEHFHMHSSIAKVCKMRSKFNEIINEIAARQGNKIINLKSCYSLQDFDRLGNLSARGKTMLWQEIDDIIERFEDPKDDKITLEPRICSYDP